MPAIVGFAAAYEQTVRDMENNNQKITALSQAFLDGVMEIDGVERNGGGLPAIVNLYIRGAENTAFLLNMDLNGVAVSIGAACASASHEPSHVYRAMGLSEREARCVIRVSVGRATAMEDVLRAAALICAG